MSRPCLNVCLCVVRSSPASERRKSSVGETGALTETQGCIGRGTDDNKVYTPHWFLCVSSGICSLFSLPVSFHMLEDAAPSTSPEFHFRQCLFPLLPGPVCSYYQSISMKIETECRQLLVARCFWLWKTNTRRRNRKRRNT